MAKDKNNSKAFDNLSSYKQEKIMQASIAEFAAKGFAFASTDIIAEEAEISKGSIFKYFETKDNLFKVAVEYIMEGFINHMKNNLQKVPGDIADLYQYVLFTGLDYLNINVPFYKLFTMISTRECGGNIYKEMRKKWDPVIGPFLKKHIDVLKKENLRIKKNEVIKVIRWVDEALDAEVLNMITPETTIEEIRRIYKNQMPLVKQLLRGGIYK